jgi:nicotinamidase-related amidase
MTRALLVIDIQRDYFPGGAFPLVGPVEAAAAAGRVIARFRAQGEPIVHIFHVEDDPEAGFLRAGSEGVEIHELVAPLPGETTIQKSEPNSFLGTTLLDHLRGIDVNELVITGMMSSMCVDSTTRAAAEHGFSNIVIHDACAAPDLTLGDSVVPGATVHAAFMAAFEGSFAHVVSVEDFLAAETLTAGER